VNPAALIPVTQLSDPRQDRVGQLVQRVLGGVASEETRRAYGYIPTMQRYNEGYGENMITSIMYSAQSRYNGYG
jgi:hypothetical protein